MNGRPIVSAGLLAWALLGVPSPARAVLLQAHSTNLAQVRSFVRDSAARRTLQLQPGIVSFLPNRPQAVQLTPALADQALQAREVRVERTSAVAASPEIQNRILQWHVPLDIRARDVAGVGRRMLPKMEMVDQGLLWDTGVGRYVGRVRVWLEDRDSPAAGYELEAPGIALEIGGEASSYDPARWEVRRVGRPSRDVDIAVAGMRPRDSIQLLVGVTSSDPRATPESATAALMVPLRGTELEVLPSRQSLQGWGLEEGEVSIHTVPSTTARPQAVSITCSAGQPRAQTAEIGANGFVKARVRSGAPGLDTLWVTSEGRRQRYALIHYQVPIAFLLWALGGGLLGSLLRSLGRTRESKRVKEPQLGILLAVGILCGILTTGVYVVGFPIFPEAVHGQSGGVVTGVFAAIGAFLGRDWLADKLGGKPAA